MPQAPTFVSHEGLRETKHAIGIISVHENSVNTGNSAELEIFSLNKEHLVSPRHFTIAVDLKVPIYMCRVLAMAASGTGHPIGAS